MTTINIKFDEEHLKDIVEKVTENIMKEEKSNFYELSDTGREEPKKKLSLMYLEAKVSGYIGEEKKVYYGRIYNTMSKDNASLFDLSSENGSQRVDELKSQGWKEEVVYK